MHIGNRRWENRSSSVLLLLLFLVAVAYAGYSYFVAPKAVMHIAGSRFDVRVADDAKTRIRGLSGTKDLPADQAMVFVFDYNGKWSMWMKDMNFPIDIVWLNEAKQVVDLVTDVAPNTYPNETFKPKEPARYVVEFQSGIVNKKGIKVGQRAVFSGMDREL